MGSSSGAKGGRTASASSRSSPSGGSIATYLSGLDRRVRHLQSTLPMIYFVFVASVLVAQNGAVIELTGQTPRVIYGQLDSPDALTLTRKISEDKLVCSGEFEAADLRIAGSTTTVADLIGEVATLRQEMAAVKQFVGMMPPPASPPLPAAPSPVTYVVIDGSPSDDTVNPCGHLFDDMAGGEDAICVTPQNDTVAGTRCCNDAGAGASLCDFNCQAVNYSIALARCTNYGTGWRLCTETEIRNEQAQQTGCSYDHFRVWTQTSCAL